MLELKNLSKSYGEVRALDGASLSVAPGGMLGFLGPNGAGKTTAMRSVFGLVRLDAGQVTWKGLPIGPEQRLQFGYMPEQRGLYPRMKVGEQLVYFAELHGMSRNDASASAARWLTTLGLSDRGEDRLEQLSHGNQQRVQLAAALVHDPELLILDEPFSGLDPIAVETLAASLQAEAARGKAVIFSSHQLDLVEDLCEDVVIINQGRNVMEGKVARLKEDSPHRRLEIDVVNGDGGWLPEMAGIEAKEVDGSLVRLLVQRDFDLEAVLSVARAVGPIRHFSFEAPSLSEMFLRAVTS
ncbi:MAG: ATP-binding cassette domain-containing protein [Acidimicrobiia bacterium]|nr:ATP-binding cassette domain-containing protein [Acidimicrobiia bacterium]